jgi:hypothetical protein
MAETPKLKVPKYEGYRAAAAKRLQSPEYKPDEEESTYEEDESENEEKE